MQISMMLTDPNGRILGNVPKEIAVHPESHAACASRKPRTNRGTTLNMSQDLIV
jgi:hypothetical protein